MLFRSRLLPLREFAVQLAVDLLGLVRQRLVGVGSLLQEVKNQLCGLGTSLLWRLFQLDLGLKLWILLLLNLVRLLQRARLFVHL